MRLSGATRVAGVIGHPVRHSLSPALHNAAFAQLALDWVYLAFDVAPHRSAEAVDAMRTLDLAGLSVTMPHKEGVAAAVDSLDPAAAALRSVNTVVRQPDGSLRGHSTDGAGFIASLHAAGVMVAGRSVCLLGAGGAARSISDALGRSGAAQVTVVNRTVASAEATAALATAAGSLGVVGTVGLLDDIRSADVVVNATSIGMGVDGTARGGAGDLPCDPAALRDGQVVVDVVYHPRITPLLQAARAAGAVTIDGLGMLVQQAALQQQLWHGAMPDVSVMAAAAERELSARRQ